MEPGSSFIQSLRMVLLSQNKNAYIQARGHGAPGTNQEDVEILDPDTSVWSPVDSLYVTFLAIVNGSEGWTPNSSGGRLAKV